MQTQLGHERKIYLYADTGTTCIILTISTKKKFISAKKIISAQYRENMMQLTLTKKNKT